VAPTDSIARPSLYAIERLKQLCYVPLHYFTVEGCDEAVRNNNFLAKDTFTISTDNDMLSLRPMMAAKASSKPIPDEQLSFHQVMIAKSLLMEHMAAQGWPETHVYALVEFFLKMEGHKLRRLPFGEAALIIYQAEVRREWHNALSSSESGPTFNIRFINEERLDHTHFLLISQDAINKAQR